MLGLNQFVQRKNVAVTQREFVAVCGLLRRREILISNGMSWRNGICACFEIFSWAQRAALREPNPPPVRHLGGEEEEEIWILIVGILGYFLVFLSSVRLSRCQFKNKNHTAWNLESTWEHTDRERDIQRHRYPHLPAWHTQTDRQSDIHTHLPPPSLKETI